MELVLFLAGGLLFGVVWGRIRAAKRPKPLAGPTKSSSAQGVYGWLAVLVAIFLVIGPLLGAALSMVSLRVAEYQEPSLNYLSSWKALKTGIWANYLICSALSIYAGVGLLRGRSPNVVTRAKVVLWLNGPINAVVLALLLSYMLPREFSFIDEVVKGLFTSLLPAMFWTLYLSHSRRVRATYGLAPKPAEPVESTV